MEVKIQSVKFDASKQLIEFVEKKMSRLEKFEGNSTGVDVTLKLDKDSEKGNFVQSMWGDGRILNWLMQKQANPIMTGSELFQQMSICRELYGNAFVYIERDYQGTPKNLWLAMCGGYNPVNGTYTLTYNTDRGMRSRFEAPAEDVIHWRNTYRHPDGYMGI